MEIRFSQQEIEAIRSYFAKIDSGKSHKQGHELAQAAPEWQSIFLLLRKLLAYGIYYGVPSDSAISYKDLQAKSQKPDSMRATVHAHFSQFENLVAAYKAQHTG